MDLRSILDLRDLDNGLEVQSIPRILPCTCLSIAFTTGGLLTVIFYPKVSPHYGWGQVALCIKWRMNELSSLIGISAILKSPRRWQHVKTTSQSLFLWPELLALSVLF